MSLNNYKKIRIRSGGERVLYFDGSGATGTLFPVFSDTFDVRINQDDLTNRDLLVTNDTTARVDVQGLDNQSSIRIDLKVYSYQLLDEIEDDGGTDIDEDYSHSVYDSLSGYSLASSCSQSKADVLYAGTGSYAAETYQLVFTDGDKIITGIQTDTGEWNDLPSNTSRIEIKPFSTAVKLPVRAKDIANDDGEILGTVAIAGSTGAVADRIQYLNDSGVLTRDETTDDANVYRPAPSTVAISAGTYNNYDLADGAVVFLGASSGAKILTGIVADPGREVTIYIGQGTLQLNHLDTNSSAGNRFALPNSEDLILQQYDSVTLSHQFNNWYVKNNYVRSNTLNPVIELASFSSNQNDYSIGDGTSFTIATTATPSADITGIAGGVNGRVIHLINRGSRDIIFRHEDSNSSANNRFLFASSTDVTIGQYSSISLRYVEGTINRWLRQS